jgi:hypothetical protein
MSLHETSDIPGSRKSEISSSIHINVYWDATKEFHCTDKGGSNFVQRTSAWVVEVEKRLATQRKAEQSSLRIEFRKFIIHILYII